MLNSYKTLINGIATAVNALKAEVKKLSGKVDNIDLPEIDGQTIIKGADGKLKTAIGGHDYEFLVGRDDSSNIGAGDVINVDDGTSEGDPRTYYWYSSLTPSSAELAGSVLRDVWTNTASVAVSRVSRVNTNVIAGYGGFPFPALYVVYKDNAEADGITFPKAGTYFMYLFDRVIKGSREQADANLVPSLPLVIDFSDYNKDIANRWNNDEYEIKDSATRQTIMHMVAEADKEGRPVIGEVQNSAGRAVAVFQRSDNHVFYHLELVKEYTYSTAYSGLSGIKLNVINFDYQNESDERTIKITSTYFSVLSSSVLSNTLVPSLYLKSSDPYSGKRFKITVDDSGTISATEVATS